MEQLKNKLVTVCLDKRWPRILWFDGPDGTRIQGEPLAVGPRLYLFRKRDRAQLTTDSPGIEASYTLSVADHRAVYRGRVTCDGRPAAEFDVTLTLKGADVVLTLQRVKEFPGFCFLTLRLPHVVSAATLDGDSRAVTCYGQGRLLDPAKCKPMLVDFSWHGAIARMCAAVIRPRFAVTLDIPGFEDLFIVDVWQYSRPADGKSYASVGVELMYRQRPVEDPSRKFLTPQHAKLPLQIEPPEPILCAKRKALRLHVIAARGKQALDWTAAARYFQSLVPKRARCEPLYRDTLVYKIGFLRCPAPDQYVAAQSFEQAFHTVQKISRLTDGRKQVCYFTMFQHNLGDSGWPWTFAIHPGVGDVAALRRVIREAPRWNAVVSFHGNFDVFSDDSPSFDPRFVARAADGRPQSQGCWGARQLYFIALPRYRAALRKLLGRMIRTYGLRQTLHLDTFSGGTFLYDARPRSPGNATAFIEAKRGIVEDARALGIDITSECLLDPFIDQIGHVWALFNWSTTWEGEEAIPLANFIYHGAISWNAARAPHEYMTPLDEKAILQSLIQGGGSSIEFPALDRDWRDIAATLYLIQPPYCMLRDRRWTGCRQKGAVRRVDYGPDSFIEVNDATPGYEIVVDGQRIAKDFVTVFPGPKKGTYLAFSRKDSDLDWPAPRGWRDGQVEAVTLTDSGLGTCVPAKIDRGRLRLSLQAFQPVRLGPR